MLMLGVHDERLRANMRASVMVMAYFQSLPRNFCLEIVINLTKNPLGFCLLLNLSNRYANRRKYLKRYYFMHYQYGGTLALKSVQYHLNRYGWHVCLLITTISHFNYRPGSQVHGTSTQDGN